MHQAGTQAQEPDDSALDEEAAEVMRAIEADSCPYLIVRYAYIDEFLGYLAEWGERLPPEPDLPEGHFMAANFAMDAEYVKSAILAGVVEGDPDCDSCGLGVTSIAVTLSTAASRGW